MMELVGDVEVADVLVELVVDSGGSRMLAIRTPSSRRQHVVLSGPQQ